ncbi:hypothetical protein K2173_017297 [Erythroxylum novogranatense]|uniref:Uncharacterized protein n=1 Tax=Erythroxylum novogranatense TaxID=1862640 RepID=A0AAV8U9Z3_9ROSI|nr:hypothetical protein K2173_017297 [Erythroxylum novogranatense]
MTDFPPNLGDGKFWLPSGIFVNEIGPSKYGSLSRVDNHQHARHLAALSLLQNHALSNCRKPTQCLAQRVQPVAGDFSVNRVVPPGCFRFHGGVQLGQRLLGYETISLFAGSDPFCEFRMQVKPQVGSCMETRARAVCVQRQHKGHRTHSFNGSGLGPGVVKESGGTGVFHPRTVRPTTFPGARKKQGTTQEIPVTRQRNHMTTEAASKLQEDCYYHLPPGMGLPQDWTY